MQMRSRTTPIPILVIIVMILGSLESVCFSDSTRHPTENRYFPIFNTRLGTQTFSPTYKFSTQTNLVETANRIREMGSTIIKFAMSPHANTKFYDLPPFDDIHSLVELARDEPSYRHVFDMPFSYYILWIYPFKSSNWHDGLSPQEAQQEFDQVYELASYFLAAYNQSGKTFLFGHWEGDWWLLHSYDPRKDPSDTAIQGMIDWLKIRQQAVEQARQDIPHQDVEVLHYTEVNLVKKAMQGGKTITNNVLPHVVLDMISYSAYDTISDVTLFTKALDYLQSQARTTGHFRRDIFVGEYGFPLDHGKRTPVQQAHQSRTLFKTAIAWGCPFVLYWQMYDNEAEANGNHARGFWLIDNKNQKQPVYREHRDFLAKAHVFKNMYRFWVHRNPTQHEFSLFAQRYESFLPSHRLQRILDSAEYAKLVPPHQFIDFITRSLLGKARGDEKAIAPYLKRIHEGESRSDSLDAWLDSTTCKDYITDEEFACLLFRGTLQQRSIDPNRQLYDKLLSQLNRGQSRSAVWKSMLDHPLFLETELSLIPIRDYASHVIRRKYFFDLSSMESGISKFDQFQEK